MTRGRAPNLALPLTKALAQQRDYRARKAANIARLEKENDTLRNENEQLAKELAILRDVHNRGHTDTRTATPSSSSADANIQAQADYQHLRTSYHALEAEVRRKEHVLHVLREKEQEAFARLEGLLKQSFEVVDSAPVPKDVLTGQQHGGTIKEEPLQTVSDTLLAPHPDVYRPHSVDSSARSFSSREAAPHYQIDPRLPADLHYARTISPSVTRAHNEISASPDHDPYRSRKRIRSSPGPSFGPVAVSYHPTVPQADSTTIPVPSGSTYISHLPQSAGQSVVEHASRPSYAPQLPFHPRPITIRELAPPRIPPYAMGSASFSTQSIASNSPGPGAPRDAYPQHILPLSTPPATAYFRVSRMIPFKLKLDLAISFNRKTNFVHRRLLWNLIRVSPRPEIAHLQRVPTSPISAGSRGRKTGNISPGRLTCRRCRGPHLRPRRTYVIVDFRRPGRPCRFLKRLGARRGETDLRHRRLPLLRAGNRVAADRFPNANRPVVSRRRTRSTLI